MAAWISATRCAAVFTSLLIAWGAGGRAWAGPEVHPAYACRPHCNGRDCAPRAVTFGHYEADWRKWPGERRPDQDFPQSIGAEELPTPKGVEEVPLPVEKFVPEVPEVPKEETKLPPPVGPETPGEILPRGKEIRIEERSPLEKPPAAPLPIEPETPAEKGLPGLPLESPSMETLPKVPLESPPTETLPGLPAGPASPPAKEGSVETPPAKEKPTAKPSGQPSSGLMPDAGGVTVDPEAPAEREPLPEAPLPNEVGDAGRTPPSPPEAQETVPIPVEPWAEPRPWQPVPARQATYQAEIEPSSGAATWGPPEEPTVERPFESRAQRSLESPVGPPVEPRVEQSPLGAPIERAYQPRVEQSSLGAPVEPVFRPRVEPPGEGLMEQQAMGPRGESPVAPQFQPAVEPAADPAPSSADAPVGLEGYCPVRLAENEQWVAGDPRWAVRHEGHTYLLSSQATQQRFLANPARYAPVLSGFDPVIAVDEKSSVPGRTEFCVVYEGRLYMFSDATSLARFHRNPQRYCSMATRPAQ